MTPEFRVGAASMDDGPDVWEMLAEFPESENGFHSPAVGVRPDQFADLLRRLVDQSRGKGLRPGFVPQTTYWGYAGDRPVGIVKVRHSLTDALRRTGGHIGYGVRPSARGRGFGTQLLRHGIRSARELGIESVLVTVNDDNRASIRVIEVNGGIADHHEDGKLYYWLPTDRD